MKGRGQDDSVRGPLLASVSVAPREGLAFVYNPHTICMGGASEKCRREGD